jgi:hypothetical protein
MPGHYYVRNPGYPRARRSDRDWLSERHWWRSSTSSSEADDAVAMAELAAASTQQRTASGQEKVDAKSNHSEEKGSFKLLWAILMWTYFLGRVLSAMIGPVGDYGLRTI